MDLSLSAEDEAFRDEVRRFLDDNLSEDLREAGRKTAGVFAEIAAGMRWHKILAARGWSAPSWPEEYGGTGWSATQRYIFARECIAVDAPRIFAMGLRMVGPVIMKFGTPEQKARYLPRIVAGDIVFCQGYSEPGSGSDPRQSQDPRGPRRLRLCHQRHQDLDHRCAYRRSHVLPGPHLDRGQGAGRHLLRPDGFDADTGPHGGADPHAGRRPRVNQVFFDNVRTPVANRIGPENAGWTVAKYLLEFERGGDAYTPNLHARLDDIRRIAREEAADGTGRLIGERSFAERLAEAEMEIQALEMIEMQVLSDLSRGKNPGAVSSAMKIRGSETPAEARSPRRRGAGLVCRALRAGGAHPGA